MRTSDLPGYFVVRCHDTSPSFGITRGRVRHDDSHTLGGTDVAFVVYGHTPVEGENLGIRKKGGLFGPKLVLEASLSSDVHDIEHFDLW